MTDKGLFDSEPAIEEAFSHKRWDEARCLVETDLAAIPDGWSPLADFEPDGERGRVIRGSFWDPGEFQAYLLHVRGLGGSTSVYWMGPSYSQRWWQLAVVNREEGKYEEAIRCIEQGLQLEPDHPYLWVQWGLILCAMAHYDEALFAHQTAETVRTWSPDSVKAWALRSQGYVLIELGRLSEAKSAYARSLALEPDNGNARNELDYIEHLLDEQELRQSKPTPADLFRGWQQGGKEKLREMLESMPEEDEE